MHSSFTVETNTLKPNQSAPKQSDLDPYCLQYWLFHKQMREQTKIAVNSGRG